MAVLDIYKDRAAKSFKRISEAIDKAYAGLEELKKKEQKLTKNILPICLVTYPIRYTVKLRLLS